MCFSIPPLSIGIKKINDFLSPYSQKDVLCLQNATSLPCISLRPQSPMSGRGVAPVGGRPRVFDVHRHALPPPTQA
ncbi:hypothetical protein DVU_1965 [Nitratidesulfovibrio vulgaris str. Hildenborough]|uniref:Uncharacterized protein n=1 Tax=Nitratidesulfovibrio vulgaris (strain ATCC 29579 / DSM 644 / CCUG 34227 / NCIMB 8303 / VKM B-1760 / Hildenborough) TaxID=882 RepID=Q72AM7_NITV2|nr:hypothetical protein DVU_1965 [Nitratidesulfovibrio vulgaris str. Hildenborough]